MIALVLVVGIAVALSVAGWVALIRDAVRVDGPTVAPRPSLETADDLARDSLAV